MRRFLAIGLALAGGVGAAWYIALGRRGLGIGAILEPQPIWYLSLRASVGASFIVAGAIAWYRQRNNIVGPLMAVIGSSWLVLKSFLFVDTPLTITLGQWLSNFPIWLVAHLLLAFPSGRVTARVERWLLGIGYGVGICGGLVPLLFWDPFGLPTSDNLVLVVSDTSLFQTALLVVTGVSVSIVLLLIAAFLRRWRQASKPARRIIAPVGWAAALVAVTAVAATVSALVELDPLIARGIYSVVYVALILVPVGYLFGLYRSQVARGAVSQLVIELSESAQPGRLRQALAQTLGDPSLEVAYWMSADNAYVNDVGQPVQLPMVGSGHIATVLERDGAPVAALIYDSALVEERRLIQAVAAATQMAVDNERLHAALRERLEEVRASRSRIVEAGDIERRRIERDLHDGAQQRLVGVALALRAATSQVVSGTDSAAVHTLDEASEELNRALAELRELARGIHPAILTEEGLGAALESLAERANVPVDLIVVPSTRLPGPVEAAAYFVVCEALANVAKYAAATQVTVAATQDRGRLVVEVSDNGIGGADASRGSGLRGLADRLAALDGSIRVQSPLGAGTIVRAEIPCV